MIDTSSADYIKRMSLMNNVTAKSGEAVNTANSLATASPTGAEPSTKNYTTVSNPTPMIQGREDVPTNSEPENWTKH